MAATKGQRIGIWIIAIFMVVGSIGSFAIIILANSNSQTTQARIQELTSQYQDAVAAQAQELSDQYYDVFSPYMSRVAPFDAAGVTELKTEDLVVGTGDEITADSSYSAYYIGWNPSGTVFDSSIDGESLKAPFSVTPGGVIEGWTKGTTGMKVGGIREITIPAELAYGESGQGDDIPPNTPIKFVVMIIPTPKAIDIPQELIDYYQSGAAQ